MPPSLTAAPGAHVCKVETKAGAGSGSAGNNAPQSICIVATCHDGRQDMIYAPLPLAGQAMPRDKAGTVFLGCLDLKIATLVQQAGYRLRIVPLAYFAFETCLLYTSRCV